jgi:hypothetical protein
VLGNLVLLENLYLQGNQLSGSIPTQLGNLTALENLYLDQNQLSGSIPAALGSLTSLQTLRLNTNLLTGSIPMELGNLSGLLYIDLGGNLLTGTVPPSLCSISTLQTLGLARNQLSGTFPSEISNAVSLINLWIDTNQLSGAFPLITSTSNPAIDIVTLNRNQFNSLPNISSLNGIVSYIDVTYNNLSFEDLEPNAGIPGIVYSPQNILGVDQYDIAVSGGPLNLSFTVGGSANMYQWVKGDTWDNIPGATNNTYSLPTTTPADAGVYHLVVNNSLVPGLQLNSAMRQVRFEGDF